MDVLIVALLLVLCYWLWNYLRRGEAYFQQKGIPYLSGWPLLGNMAGPTLLVKHHSEVIQEIYDCNKEAKYVGALDFLNPVIVLRDPELIKNVTIKVCLLLCQQLSISSTVKHLSIAFIVPLSYT